MYSPTHYRIDGVWGLKEQGRLFPVFDGAMCSEKPLHGSWCAPSKGYRIAPTGLNLYHLKMISPDRRRARRDLYNHLDPNCEHQRGGYDYLTSEQGIELDIIKQGRDFFPAHDDDAIEKRSKAFAEKHGPISIRGKLATPWWPKAERGNLVLVSQSGQYRIRRGKDIISDPALSVVVIGLTAPQSLATAVQSLIQGPPIEIIVVNSGGGDAAAVLFDLLDVITLIDVENPIFVGAARNIGILHARAQYIAFLAADCCADRGWINYRLEFHRNGAAALSSVVVSNKSDNAFAMASHLLTYSRRMPGLPASDVARYGASYDKSLFDRYGLFSEYMRIGEDSEFHDRFNILNTVQHSDLIRTIHDNPTTLRKFIRDQFCRGARARYLLEYFRGDFTPKDLLFAVRRRYAGARIMLRRTNDRSTKLVFFTTRYLALPLGGAIFFLGSAANYVKVWRSRRLAYQANKALGAGSTATAAAQIQTALRLRPAYSPLDEMLGEILASSGAYHDSSRALYRSADRRYRITWHRPLSYPIHKDQMVAPSMGVVILNYSDSYHTLKYIRTCLSNTGNLPKIEFCIIPSRIQGGITEDDIKDLNYYSSVRIVSRKELQSSTTFFAGSPEYVTVATDDFLPETDWLGGIYDYCKTMPEVEYFEGRVRADSVSRGGWLDRLVREHRLIPCSLDNFRLFENTSAMSICLRIDAFERYRRNAETAHFGVSQFRGTVLRNGGVIHFAAGWSNVFRCDIGAKRLITLFWDDGRHSPIANGTKIAEATENAHASSLFSIAGLCADFARRRMAIRSVVEYPWLEGNLRFASLFALELIRQIGRWSRTK
jgi:glycosyltransferase involved in cell wall biosynthesis